MFSQKGGKRVLSTPITSDTAVVRRRGFLSCLFSWKTGNLRGLSLSGHVALDVQCPGNVRGLVAGSPLPGKHTVTASESLSLTVNGL